MSLSTGRRDSSWMPGPGRLIRRGPRESRDLAGAGRVARCGPGPGLQGSTPERCARASQEGQTGMLAGRAMTDRSRDGAERRLRLSLDLSSWGGGCGVRVLLVLG